MFDGLPAGDVALIIVSGVLAMAGLAFVLIVLPVGYVLQIIHDHHEPQDGFNARFRRTLAAAWSKAQRRELVKMQGDGQAMWTPLSRD